MSLSFIPNTKARATEDRYLLYDDLLVKVTP